MNKKVNPFISFQLETDGSSVKETNNANPGLFINMSKN